VGLKLLAQDGLYQEQVVMVSVAVVGVAAERWIGTIKTKEPFQISCCISNVRYRTNVDRLPC
jgi:hypothetical protein